MQVWPRLQAVYVARWVCICITAGCPLFIHCAGCWSWYPGRRVFSFLRKGLPVGPCIGPERGQCQLLQADCDPSIAQSMRIRVIIGKICYTECRFRPVGLNKPLHRARDSSLCWTNLRVICNLYIFDWI